MREMKSSHIPFCEAIPADWNEMPNKYLFSEHSVKVGKEHSKYQLLSLTKNGVKEKDINAPGGKVPDSYENYQTVTPGDMIFCLFDLDCSAVFSGLSGYGGMITSAYDVLKPKDRYVDAHFVDYWFQYVFSNRYYKMFSKNIRYTVTSEMFGSIYTPVPDISTQQKIGEILDKKSIQIDALIENQEAQIEKLKQYKQSLITEIVTKGLNPDVEMKDSGVEWIGYIPNNWGLIRIGDVGDFKKGPFGSAVRKDMFVEKGSNTYKVYEQKNAIYKDVTLGYYYLSEEDYNQLQTFAVQENDILVSCAGTIGESYIVPQNYEAGIINQALMRIRLNGKISNEYFSYVFSCIMNLVTPKYSNGSAMKNIPPFNYLLKFILPCPFKNVQQEIVAYLDNQCAKIDKLIEIKQSKIAKLNEYKKSLIYEYVTGKKEVC